jgi:excisionase family DNA binding protein
MGGVPSLDASLRELIEEIVDTRLAAALATREAASEHLTSAEAARYARVSSRTIRRWLDDGRLRARRAGRKLLIARADLEALLRDGGRRDHELTPEQLAARDFE